MIKKIALGLLAMAAVLVSITVVLVMSLQAPRMDVPDRNSWVFNDVILVESGSPPRPGSRLRIDAGQIVEVTQPRSAQESPARSLPAVAMRGGGDEGVSKDSGDTTDLAGLYISPGLSDLHVHYPPKIAVGNAELWSLLLLAHGVTSIRETGSIDGSIFAVREAIRDGRFPGPRIFACGAMLDGEEPSFPSNRVVATPEEAREAVASLAAEGADCIKAYNMLSLDALAAIREAAAKAGLPLIGHAPHSATLEEAGLVDLQHGTGAVVVDRERVGRSDFLAADWVSMDDERIAHVARVSLEQDIAHTPTLVNGRMRLLLADDQQAEEVMARDSGLRHLPRFWQAAWGTIWGAPFVIGDAESEERNEFFRTRQAMMTTGLHEAGVRIHAGTDTLMPFVAPGSSLHGELADLVAAGIAPDDVWEIATREAGRTLALPGLGSIAVGAPADLIFLRSNPSGDIAAFSEIEAVLADGRLYRRAELDAMLATADAHFHGTLYSGVMNTVVAVVQSQFVPDHEGTRNFGGQP
ncbi:MAG: amidohydrolase family protein [Deltaproteobacteria bacterium]|nr:amidohydrolase family protein [Deltaproteobacteria bacterium]